MDTRALFANGSFGLRCLLPAALAICRLASWAGAVGVADTQPTLESAMPVFYQCRDGTAFLAAPNGVFVRQRSSEEWTFYPLDVAGDPSNSIVAVAGGAPDHPLVVFQGDDDAQKLEILGPSTRPATITEQDVRGQRDASYRFASERVGCRWAGGDLSVSVNGGRQWSSPSRPLPHSEGIRCLQWISETEVAVGGEHGTIADVTVAKAGGVVRWLARPKFDDPVIAICSINNAVFAYTAGIGFEALESDTGKKIAEYPPPDTFHGMVASSNHVFIYGADYLRELSWDGRALHEERRISPVQVLAIFPLREPVLFITFSPDGIAQGCILHDGILTPEKAHIHVQLPAPATRPAEGEDLASPEEFRDAVAWSMKLDFDTRQRVWSEGNKKTNLTPRQRVLWVRGECKRIVESGEHLAK